MIENVQLSTATIIITNFSYHLPFLWAWSLREIDPRVSPTIDGVLESFDMVVKLLRTDWSSAKNALKNKLLAKLIYY